VKEEIRRRLARDKRVEKLRPIGEQLAQAAKSSSLEAAAAQRNLPVEKSTPFARVDAIPGLGQFTPAIGAAFAAPVGQVAGPFKAVDAMVVMRVDTRSDANRQAFEAEKSIQRQQFLQSARQQKVDEFLTGLRESVKVDDRRTQVLSQLRRQSDS
jgi:peptidyl-prolyl cis-trans isomerase D